MQTSRIYLSQSLSKEQMLCLDDGYYLHYLRTVLRLKTGDKLRIFNSIDGEFLAEIEEINKRNMLVKIMHILRSPVIEPTLILGICLIKMDKMLEAINMAVQLGITHLLPIIAERSQFKVINQDRVQKCITEAVEQSERLNIPKLEPIVLLNNIPTVNPEVLIYLNEHEETTNSMLNLKNIPEKVLLIIGPEGGFSDKELKLLGAMPNSYSVSLGANILRAETAVCAAIAQLQLVRKRE